MSSHVDKHTMDTTGHFETVRRKGLPLPVPPRWPAPRASLRAAGVAWRARRLRAVPSRINLSTSLGGRDLVRCCDFADYGGRDYDGRDCGSGCGRRCCRSCRSARAMHCQTPSFLPYERQWQQLLPPAAELAVGPSLRNLLLVSRLLQLLRSPLSLPCQHPQP